MLTLGVDFDGTLVEPNLPIRWRPGARDALIALSLAGHRLILHSARSTPPEPADPDSDREAFYARGVVPEEVIDFWERFGAMRDFLRAENVWDVVEVWQAPGKPRCEFFVDDRAEAPDWKRIVRELAGGVSSAA